MLSQATQLMYSHNKLIRDLPSARLFHKNPKTLLDSGY